MCMLLKLAPSDVVSVPGDDRLIGSRLIHYSSYSGSGKALIVSSAPQDAGEQRLLAAKGSIREAFDGLDLGWTYEDVWDYLEGSPTFQTMGDERGKVAGLVMGFAIVAVERELELVREEATKRHAEADG